MSSPVVGRKGGEKRDFGGGDPWGTHQTEVADRKWYCREYNTGERERVSTRTSEEGSGSGYSY